MAIPVTTNPPVLRGRALTDALDLLRGLSLLFLGSDLLISLTFALRRADDDPAFLLGRFGFNVLCLVVVGALLWNRSRLAAALTPVAAVVSLTGTGGSAVISLIAGWSVWAGALARHRRWTGLGLLAYAVALVLTTPGQDAMVHEALIPLGWIAGIGLGVGSVVRWLWQHDVQTRLQRQAVAARLRQIREAERRRLAKDLRATISTGLDQVDGHVRDAAASPTQRLHAVDEVSRRVLTDLRALLELLREPDSNAERCVQADQLERRHRWAQPLVGRDPRPLVVALTVLLVWAALAPQRELAAMVMLAWGASTAIARSRLHPALGVICLMAYGIGLILLHDVSYLGIEVLGLITGLGIGLPLRYFALARSEVLHDLRGLENERETARRQDRDQVARDLHDIVGHQLSLTSLQVMASSVSEDPDVLREHLACIAGLTKHARTEISTLTRSLEETPDIQAAPATPAQLVRSLQTHLRQQGLQPVLALDPGTEHLDHVTATSVTRVLQEAATNIARYAQPRSTCRFEVHLAQDDVAVRVTSELPPMTTPHPHSSGTGLRGLQERIALCNGRFHAGAHQGRWIVEAHLPRQLVGS